MDYLEKPVCHVDQTDENGSEQYEPINIFMKTTDLSHNELTDKSKYPNIDFGGKGSWKELKDKVLDKKEKQDSHLRMRTTFVLQDGSQRYQIQYNNSLTEEEDPEIEFLPPCEEDELGRSS